MRFPHRAAAVLAEVVERLEFRDRLREYSVWNVWDEVVGDLLAAKAQPLRIEDGRLSVGVSNSTWMQELQYLKDEIRSRLNRRLRAPIVRDIYLVLGQSRSRREEAETPRIHPVDESSIAALVPDVHHPELEAALRRLARARARRLGSQS